MGEVDGARHERHEARGLARRRGRPLLETVREAPALHEAHRVEVPAVVLADLVDGNDVRMVEARRGPRLRVEAEDLLGRREAVPEDQLEGDVPTEPLVARAPDRSHAAAGHLLDPDVGADTAAAAHSPPTL